MKLTKNQSLTLDALRGLAAQIVLVGHLYALFIGPQSLVIQNFGVLVFFVLSGFLICYVVLTKREKFGHEYDFVRYLSDRFFRIFVPLVPALLFIVLLDVLVVFRGLSHEYTQNIDAASFLSTLLMLQQYPLIEVLERFSSANLGFDTFGSARPFWTVAQEWWLYVAFGWFILVVMFGERRNLRGFCILAVLAIVPLFNSVSGIAPGISLVWILGAGLGALFYFSESAVLPVRSRVLLAFSIFAFLMCLVRIAHIVLFGDSGQFDFYDLIFAVWFTVAVSGVFLTIAHKPVVNRLVDVSIRGLASFSYSLYLLHYSIILFFRSFKLTTGDVWLDIFVLFIVCNAISVVFYWLFEKHYRIVQQACNRLWRLWLVRRRPAGN